MNDEGSLLLLLLLGPVGAIALYWVLYRYYRNTDKSHAFEYETTVKADTVTGSDQKVDEVTGTQQQRISGENLRDYRNRVRRIQSDINTR